jgi:hypothetical protein
MRKKYFLAATAVALGLAAIACANVRSQDIKSSGFDANYLVTTNDATQTADAEAWYQSGSSYIELTGDDTASCDGKSLGYFRAPITNAITYSASVPRHPAGQTYAFLLHRADGDYTATVAQPPSTTIAAPAQNALVRVTDPITITWTPGNGGTVDIEISDTLRECVQGSQNVPDTGTFIFSGVSVKGATDAGVGSDAGAIDGGSSSTSSQCKPGMNGQITITHRTTGSATSPGLNNVSISARQVDSIPIRLDF